MGAPSSSNVISGAPLVTGGVWRAPVGTALPTDASTALAAAYIGLGYVTNDGMTSSEKRDTKDVLDWSGVKVATLITGFTDEFKFGFLEFLNSLVHTAIRGTANVIATAATASHGNQVAIKHNAAAFPHGVWVFELGVSSGARVRIVVPDGQVTALDDTDYKSDDLAGQKVTLSAYADSSGNSHYTYTDDGLKTS